MRLNSYKILVFLLLILVLTGCGFHLRGSQNLPPQLNLVYIDSSQPFAPFEQALRLALQDANIQVIDSPSIDAVTLKIVSKSLTATLISLSVSTQVTQYNLVYSVNYQLINKNGKIIIPSEAISSADTYSANNNQMLGTSNQQDMLAQTLRNNTVFLLITRLSSNKVRLAFEKSSTPHEK